MNYEASFQKILRKFNAFNEAMTNHINNKSEEKANTSKNTQTVTSTIKNKFFWNKYKKHK